MIILASLSAGVVVHGHSQHIVMPYRHHLIALSLLFDTGKAYCQEPPLREYLDCAVLSTTCSSHWVSDWLGSYKGGRLQLFPLDPTDIGSPDAIGVLAAAAIQLKRYDACLMPITEHNLPWARTTLATAQGILSTPVLGLVRDLKAAALNDLYALGIADFIRDPLCPEELRVRIERLLADKRYHMAAHTSNIGISENAPSYPCQLLAVTQETMCATILDRSGHELDAFAVASASRCATSKESFKAAKNKVINRFERAYITAALGRHSGNIAMAARSAQKHRRAFWALMRKHEIDAAPFRCDPTPNSTRDG